LVSLFRLSGKSQRYGKNRIKRTMVMEDVLGLSDSRLSTTSKVDCSIHK
jgi:hypothetical protein